MTYETVVERHLDGVMRFVLSRRARYRSVSYSRQSVDVLTRLPLQSDAACKFVARGCSCAVELNEDELRYSKRLSQRVLCNVLFCVQLQRRAERIAWSSCVCVFGKAQATSSQNE